MRREQYEINSDGKNVYIKQENDGLSEFDQTICLTIEQLDTFIEDLKKVAVSGGQPEAHHER